MLRDRRIQNAKATKKRTKIKAKANTGTANPNEWVSDTLSLADLLDSGLHRRLETAEVVSLSVGDVLERDFDV